MATHFESMNHTLKTPGVYSSSRLWEILDENGLLGSEAIVISSTPKRALANCSVSTFSKIRSN